MLNDSTNWKSLCEEQQKIIVLKDKGVCEYRALNPQMDQVSAYQVDDNLIKEGIRCDFLLLNNTLHEAYYVELKGSDIRHAMEQIKQTVIRLSKYLSEYNPFYRIVYRTGTHSINDSSVINWKRSCGFNKGREVVIVKQRKIEECINNT